METGSSRKNKDLLRSTLLVHHLRPTKTEKTYTGRDFQRNEVSKREKGRHDVTRGSLWGQVTLKVSNETRTEHTT